MIKLLKKYQKNKLLLVLTIILILSLIAGFLYLSILSKENKDLVVESVTNFFTSLNTGIDTKKVLAKTLTSNLLTVAIIWALGISIIGIPIIIGILIFKNFALTFTFTSIIYTYKYVGIIKALIYIIPLLINSCIIFILSYYALSFSLMLFNYLFKRKEYNRREIVKRYLKLLLFTTIGIILSSVIETYIIPSIFNLISL